MHPARSAADLPRSVAATLALIETGLHDYATIASAVGLTAADVRRIDMSDDPLIRRLGVDGLPRGEFFHLRRKVRCPKCAAWIVLAPCVACHVEKKTGEEPNGESVDE
jgi:hypothetical protein